MSTQPHRWGDLRGEPRKMTYGKLPIKKSQCMCVVGVLVDSFTDGCLVTSSYQDDFCYPFHSTSICFAGFFLGCHRLLFCKSKSCLRPAQMWQPLLSPSLAFSQSTLNRLILHIFFCLTSQFYILYLLLNSEQYAL